MSFTQADTVKGRANTAGVAPDVIVMDERGMLDASGRYFSAYHQFNWPLLVGSLSTFIWHCHEGIWQLSSVSEAHTVVGGSGATATLVACPQAVAIGSGTPQLTAAFDLTITAPAYRFGTLVAAPAQLTRGDALAILFAGTLTGLVGELTYIMKRIG